MTTSKPQPAGATSPERIQAELEQINQELISLSKEQAAELARLNAELQLQMAMLKQAEARARLNEERFLNMADNIQQGLTIYEAGQMVFMNARACEIFGDCPSGDLQTRILKFAAPEEQARLRQALSEAEIQGSFPLQLQYWIIGQDGGRRCVRERYSHSLSDGLRRTFIITSDITEQAQAYQNLENAVNDRTRELFTLLDISHRIASTLELEPLLHIILEQMQTIIPYSGAAIFSLEDGKLQVLAYQIPGVAGGAKSLSLSLDRSPLYLPVLKEKKVLIVDDIHGETPLLHAFQESRAEAQVRTFVHARSWIGIPLIVRDQATGLMSLTHSEPGFYNERHARLAEAIVNQAAVAIENARLYQQAQYLAVLEERQRIARELHDSVTQLLYGIRLYCTATSRAIRSQNFQQVEQNLEEIKVNALIALQEMRVLILELNPPLLQNQGLVAALKASLEIIETRTGLETEWSVSNIERLPRPIETEFYRIAMEALNNLVRYARAKKVLVRLYLQDQAVYLEISDNGIGFDLNQARNSRGMGLINMEERARQLNGKLEIHSQPGMGTRIVVCAPLEAAPSGG